MPVIFDNNLSHKMRRKRKQKPQNQKDELILLENHYWTTTENLFFGPHDSGRTSTRTKYKFNVADEAIHRKIAKELPAYS